MIYNTQLVTEKDNQTTTRTSKPNYPNSKNQQKKMIKNKNGQLRNHTKKKWPYGQSVYFPKYICFQVDIRLRVDFVFMDKIFTEVYGKIMLRTYLDWPFFFSLLHPDLFFGAIFG